MNPEVLRFFNENYSPGRVCLIGADDFIGKLIRFGQSSITPDKKPSLWSHAFLMGEKRRDGRDDGSIYIFESDLYADTKSWQVYNGVQESRLLKWCKDSIEHACVLGMDMTQEKQTALLTKALEFAYDEKHLRYPVGELFGTLLAYITRRFNKKNIFDDKYAVQCATFVRMCYQYIEKDFLPEDIDLTHSSPETIHQSQIFSYRKEWHRSND